MDTRDAAPTRPQPRHKKVIYGLILFAAAANGLATWSEWNTTSAPLRMRSAILSIVMVVVASVDFWGDVWARRGNDPESDSSDNNGSKV